MVGSVAPSCSQISVKAERLPLSSATMSTAAFTLYCPQSNPDSVWVGDSTLTLVNPTGIEIMPGESCYFPPLSHRSSTSTYYNLARYYIVSESGKSVVNIILNGGMLA